MKKLIRASLMAMTFLWGAGNANATPILSFDASDADISKNYWVGDSIVMELWISGLADIDLAGFDLTLSFNPLVTGYQSTSFAPTLNDEDFIELEDWLLNSSTLILTGVSLAPDLSAQADTFRIATIAFTALSAGSSLLSFDSSLVSDEFAAAFVTTNFAANITVKDRQIAVSEPGALLLTLSFVLALSLRHCRRA